MRGRVVLALVVLLVGGGLVAAAVALGTGSSEVSDRFVAVDVAELGRDEVLPVEIGRRVGEIEQPRVFVVRRDGDLDAFLAVSTHLGCVIRAPGDPDYGEGRFEIDASTPRFEDPCGGALWSLDGRCLAGPCPRGLDRYRVAVRGDTAYVDLRRLETGPDNPDRG